MTQDTHLDALPARPLAATTRARLVGVAIVLLIFLTVVAIIALRGVTTYRIAADQDLFHLPVVRQFAEQWPRPDLRNYASATAPGYHLLMAAVAKYVSPDLTVLRFAGGGFGVLFIGVLAWAVSIRSVWLALPAAMSVYVLSSTVWLLPENAAWAFGTLALVLAVRGEGAWLALGLQLTLAALIAVRQVHVWTFGAVAAGYYALWDAGRMSAVRAVTRTVIACGLAAALLVMFYQLWHGLTPPAFQPGSSTTLPLATRTGGLALGAPAMLLAVFGVFGPWLLPWLWPEATRRKVLRLFFIGAVAGLLLGLVPSSTYDTNNRSGLWNVVRVLPTFAGRSPLFVGLAMAGGGVVAVAIAALRGRSRLVLTTALAGFALVQMANPSLWQRYYEPFALLWLALAASEIRGPSICRAWRVAGLVAVVALQLAVVIVTLGRGD